jgi:endonuclease-3
MKSAVPKLETVLDVLERQYGEQVAAGPHGPYEMILFVNCGYPATDASCGKGYAELEREVGTKPDEILGAPKTKLAKLMRLGGIVPELRAQRLKDIATLVNEEFGGDLKWALERFLAEEKKGHGKGIRLAKKALKEFPVIGEPGADKILLFARLVPSAAVPSACPFVPQRILFGGEDKNYAAGYRAAQEAIAAATPEDFDARQRAYLLLKRHGQEICKRTKPKCEVCEVRAMCCYFRQGPLPKQ